MISTESTPEMEELTVAEIALNFPQSIKVLHRYGIDYCCNGNKLFIKACQKAKVDANKIWIEINSELPIPGFNKRLHFKNWDTDMLMDYILQQHHEYIRMTIPEIKNLLNIVCSVHSDNSELEDIRSHFNALSDELLEHLPVEEEVLFPALRRIKKSAVSLENYTLLWNVQNNIVAMEHEHERAGELMKEIRKLSNNYTPPIHACPTFQMAYRMLEEFEQDMMQHIHLENNVLFPRVKSARN
jgi:regulator of cell morphogenesis and NO signaling